ncbi:TetR family transcriptional regulator [Thermoactinospora rubra]|uniref:TetR family transcriptional regulator n=1 Tax=Thermoactinospora rubra TaxID=1088767 RepID=UPI0013020377|nr:TetR family transcriptional regulator [Thermoactinospora rubra]
MGLRERKKEKTRLAILDAALDLFLEQGYDATTVEQIAGAAEVSPRTFFRYFSGKEHLALWYHDYGEAVMREALDSRPADEPPFTSLLHALRAVADDIQELTPEDAERFLKMRKVYEANPTLIGKAVGRAAETELRLVDAVARRTGLDPDESRLPYLVVAFAMSITRVGFECPRPEVTGVSDLAARLRETVDLAERVFVPGWDRP